MLSGSLAFVSLILTWRIYLRLLP